MATKTQEVTFKIPDTVDKEDLADIGSEIAEVMRRNAENGKGAAYGEKGIISSYKRFPGYSKSYAESLDFKIAGKSAGDVNLTLSGDMLASFDIKKIQGRKITLGFQDELENAKADGNIRGTYGQDKPNSKKARNFLGITEKDFERIIKKYERTSRSK